MALTRSLKGALDYHFFFQISEGVDVYLGEFESSNFIPPMHEHASEIAQS